MGDDKQQRQEEGKNNNNNYKDDNDNTNNRMTATTTDGNNNYETTDENNIINNAVISAEDLVLKAMESSAVRRTGMSSLQLHLLQPPLYNGSTTTGSNSNDANNNNNEKEVDCCVAPPDLRRSQDIQQLTPGAYRAGGSTNRVGGVDNISHLVDSSVCEDGSADDDATHSQTASSDNNDPNKDIVEATLVPASNNNDISDDNGLRRSTEIIRAEPVESLRRKKRFMCIGIIVMSLITIAAVTIATTLVLDEAKERKNESNNNIVQPPKIIIINEDSSDSSDDIAVRNSTTLEEGKEEETTVIQKQQQGLGYSLTQYDRITHHAAFIYLERPNGCIYEKASIPPVRGSFTISCGNDRIVYPKRQVPPGEEEEDRYYYNTSAAAGDKNGTLVIWNENFIQTGIDDCIYINPYTAQCYINSIASQSHVVFSCGLNSEDYYYPPDTTTTTTATVRVNEALVTCMGDHDEDDQGDDKSKDGNDRHLRTRRRQLDYSTTSRPTPILAAVVLGRLCQPDLHDDKTVLNGVFHSINECDNAQKYRQDGSGSSWNETTTLYCYQTQPRCFIDDDFNEYYDQEDENNNEECTVELTNFAAYDTITDPMCEMDAFDIHVFEDKLVMALIEEETNRLENIHGSILLQQEFGYNNNLYRNQNQYYKRDDDHDD